MSTIQQVGENLLFIYFKRESALAAIVNEEGNRSNWMSTNILNASRERLWYECIIAFAFPERRPLETRDFPLRKAPFESSPRLPSTDCVGSQSVSGNFFAIS